MTTTPIWSTTPVGGLPRLTIDGEDTGTPLWIARTRRQRGKGLLGTDGIDGVWESAAANMEMYLQLAEKARAFRADPEIRAALDRSGIYELAEPTLAEGESLDDFLAAFEDFDAEAAAARDYHYVDLYEKAVQHLIG